MMKKGILLVVVMCLLAVSVFASTEVISVKTYNRAGTQVHRDYLLEGDRVSIIMYATGETPSQRIELSNQNKQFSAGCVRISEGKYKCTYTILSPESMVGTYQIFANGVDTNYEFYMNPSYIPLVRGETITITTPVRCEVGRMCMGGGEITYQPKLDVKINPIADADAKIYISGNNVYSSTIGMCPGNAITTSKIKYSTNGGATWKSLSKKQAYIGTNSAMIEFKLNIPSYCEGKFDLTNRIYFTAVVQD